MATKSSLEINNVRGSVTECRKAVINLTIKLDAARKQLYEDMVRLYQYENDINIGDTITWEWYIPDTEYGFMGLNKEPEPIGEIISLDYTDFTGIQINVKYRHKNIETSYINY